MFVPKSPQPKLLGVIVTVGAPQLSVTLDTTSFMPIAAAPFASSATSAIVDNVVIEGALLSSTVTVIVDVAALPDASVAVIVTVFAPRSAHVNVVWL